MIQNGHSHSCTLSTFQETSEIPAGLGGTGNSFHTFVSLADKAIQLYLPVFLVVFQFGFCIIM